MELGTENMTEAEIQNTNSRYRRNARSLGCLVPYPVVRSTDSSINFLLAPSQGEKDWHSVSWVLDCHFLMVKADNLTAHCFSSFSPDPAQICWWSWWDAQAVVPLWCNVSITPSFLETGGARGEATIQGTWGEEQIGTGSQFIFYVFPLLGIPFCIFLVNI